MRQQRGGLAICCSVVATNRDAFAVSEVEGALAQGQRGGLAVCCSVVATNRDAFAVSEVEGCRCKASGAGW